MSKNSECSIDGPEIDASILQQASTKGVAYKIVFDKRVEFTKDVAASFIEMPEFKGERNLRDSHVESLIQHVKNGTFLVDQACLVDCVCKYDGVTRRLNGHHTSWVRHYLTSDWNPKIRHLRYEVDSEDDFRKLYSLIDRGAPRTNAHVAQSRLFDTEAFKGLSKRAISYSKDGMSYWLWGNPDSRSRHRVDEIVNLMETDHYQLCYDVATFANDFSNAEFFMKRACVSAAIFVTFNKAKGDAIQFWTSIRTGVGIDNVNDPRKTLRDYLQRFKVLGANSFSKANMVTSETMFRACIFCWNAWRKGVELRQVTSSSASQRPQVK